MPDQNPTRAPSVQAMHDTLNPVGIVALYIDLPGSYPALIEMLAVPEDDTVLVVGARLEFLTSSGFSDDEAMQIIAPESEAVTE